MCELFSSNVLNNNTHYSFRFAFHQEATEGSPEFFIGLVAQEDKEKTNSSIFRYRENK